MTEKCVCCGEKTLAIVKHHISYYPEKVIEICANCHNIIHNPPTDPEDFERLPKTLRELIKANIKRKTESENILGFSLDSNEIDFEMKKERLVLMKLVNKHWMLRNAKVFSEMYSPIARTSSSEIDRSSELTERNKEHFDRLEQERSELERKFLIPTQKQTQKGVKQT